MSSRSSVFSVTNFNDTPSTTITETSGTYASSTASSSPAASPPAVLAMGNFITPPISCVPMYLFWSGGTPPYTVECAHITVVSSKRLLGHTTTNAGNWTWMAAAPAGSHIDIVVYSGSSGVGAFNNTVLGHVSMPGMQPNTTCLEGLTPSDFEPLPSSPKPTKSSLSTILPATVVPIMLGLSLTYFFLRRRGTFHRLRRRNGKARLLIDHDHDDPSHDNSTALATRHASSSRFIGRPSLASSSESTVAHAPSPDPFLVAGPSHLSSSLSKHSRMGLSNPDGADSELRSLPRALSSATQTTRTTTRTGTHATSTSISSLSTLDPFADHGIASVAGVAHSHDYAYAYNLDQTQHTALLGKLADPEAEPLPRLARDEYADDSRWTPSRASSSRSTYRNGRPPSAVGTAASHSRSHESGTAVDPFSDLGSH